MDEDTGEVYYTKYMLPIDRDGTEPPALINVTRRGQTIQVEGELDYEGFHANVVHPGDVLSIEDAGKALGYTAGNPNWSAIEPWSPAVAYPGAKSF
jgi:hypothetical protein